MEQLTNHILQQPRNLLSQFRHRFAANKIFSTNLAIKLAIFFTAVLSLPPSLSLFKQGRRLGVIIVDLLTEKWTLWSTLHTAFCHHLSLSLSHTHIHTRARACVYMCTLQVARLAANTLLPQPFSK